MLTKNQKLWLEALRSGEYKQGYGELESAMGGYCCLGVACKVAEQNGVYVLKENGYITGLTLAGHVEVKNWLGLRSSNGAPEGLDDPDKEDDFVLTELNDYQQKSFEEIADIIEQHPEWYFVSEEAGNE